MSLIFFKSILFLCVSLLSECSIIELYEQQVVESPHDYRALYNVGVQAFKENNFERARDCFTFLKSVDVPGHEEQIFYNAGNTEVHLQNYEDALASFEKVLLYNPKNEAACKKIDYIKALLEQQKQKEQQEQQKEDQQDSENSKNQEKTEEQKSGDKEHDSQSQENNKDAAQQNKEKKSDGQEDRKKENEKNNTDQKQDSQQDQNSKQADQEDQKPSSADDHGGQEDEKKLTEQERQVLALTQDLDERMHEEMEKKNLQQAQGVVHARNNW